jgi:hypothetical protein
VKKIILLLSVILPNFIKIFIYRRILGWQIGKKVKIGLSLIDAEKVIIKDNVRIGHFNSFRRLKKLELGNNVYLLNLNFFYCTSIYRRRMD